MKFDMCRIETLSIDGDSLAAVFALKFSMDGLPQYEEFDTFYGMKQEVRKLAARMSVQINEVVYGPENPPTD